MQAITERNIVVARLDDGERLIPRIMDIFEDQGIYSGIVLTGIGMLRDFTLNFFDGKKYVERQYNRPMELVSLQGSVAIDSSIHLHAMVADKSHNALGGHISSGIVNNLVELTIMKLELIQISRKKDPLNGLGTMILEPRRSVNVDIDHDDEEE